MASSVPPPGAPPQRPSISSGYPIQQRPNPDNSLPDAVQNLYVTPRPTSSPAGIPNSMPHPPPPAGARPPPPSFAPPMPFNNPAISAAPHGIPPPPAANIGYARPVVAPPPPFGGANLAAMGNRPMGAPPAAMGQSAFPRPGPPGASPFSSTTNPGSRPSSMPPMMSNGQPAFMPPPPGARPSAPMPGQPIQSSSSMMQTPPPAIGVRPTAGSPPGMQAPPPPSMFPTQPPPPPITSSNLGAPSIYGSQQMQPPPLYGSQPPPPLTGSSPYGFQPWQSQSASRVPMVSATPQQRPYGSGPAPTQPLPLNAPGMGHPPGGPGVMGMNRTGPESPLAGASRIDPNQMPRPIPSSSVVVFETRVNNQANLPPSATSDFVVKDTGNCSPRYMRCTMNQIPCTSDLLSTSNLPLALMVQPMALPHPSEEPIQVVDFGEGGPVRCSRCKGYINPFMRFIEQGRRFICNLCGFTDETPRDYCCNLGPDGRRRDADERPELCRGTVEFVATKEYMVRDAMPPVYFFLVDVSMNAVQTGATAAACSAITQVINDLPEGPSTLVGIATYDSTIHFYHLKRSLQQPVMLIVPDVEDVYTPLETDLIVQLSECRQHLEQLLDSIPTMFQTNKVSESAFGAAIKGAFLAMKSTGGKLLVFQSVLPSAGIGSLSVREAEGRTNVTSGEKEAHKLLRPADKIFKTMAIEFAEYQVCVDIFVTTQTYVDIASISVVPRTTGGQVYYYFPFSAVSDSAKLYNDLRWNITRPQGFEAVMRVRCSQGLQVQEYYGNFCKRIPTDIDLPAIDCDKTIMVTFKHDDKFQEGSECAFQCALLYTTIYGQRRIRVTTLSLPCTTMLNNLFRTADLDSQFTCFLKQAANDVPTSPLPQVRDQVMNLSINVLYAYRKFCATVSSAGQLILPEGLKLLPLYTLALLKSAGLRVDGRIDDRSYWISRVSSLSTSLVVPLVYPRMLAIHNLNTKADTDQDAADTSIPPSLPLSSEHVTDDGVFLLENGEEGLIYIGNTVATDILQKLFGVSSVNNLSNQFLLQQFENDLSKKLNVVVNEIRSQRCSYLRFQLCRKGEPSGHMFFSYMVEDKTSTGLSYVEFLIHIHRQIQSKMS